MILLRSKLGITFARPAVREVLDTVKDGGAIFTATAAGYLYNQGPVLILNVFTDLSTVGKYSIAQKISVVAVSTFQSLSQAYFPHLSRLWSVAPARFVAVVRRYIYATQMVSMIIMGTLFGFAPLIYLISRHPGDHGYPLLACRLPINCAKRHA
jgi:O-antigen/teichoic acid export membrane protein